MANKFCTAGNCNFSKSWTSKHTGKTIKNAKCSKCSRLDNREEIRNEFAPRKSKKSVTSSSTGSRKNSKSISKNTRNESKQSNSSRANQRVTERIIEKVRYEDPSEIELKGTKLPQRQIQARQLSIPNGSISQISKSENYSQRLKQALIRENSMKVLKGRALDREREAVSFKFRKFIQVK